MKTYTNSLYMIFILLFFINCTTDTESIENDLQTTTIEQSENTTSDSTEGSLSYFGLTPGDTWTYNVFIDDSFSSEDILTVVDPVITDGIEFSDFEASVGNTGFMTNVISNGLVIEESGVLTYSGVLEFPLDDTNVITIEVNDAIVYDPSQGTGTVLSEISQSMEQNVMGFQLTINTIITTQQLDNDQTDVIVEDFVFENVIKSNLIVNAEITTTLAGIPVTIMAPQDVYNVTNHYAQDIGLVASWVDFQYELEDLGVDLPFPQSLVSTTDQVLSAFDVTLN